jgi:secreted PhoX family phosphatase
MLNKKIRDVIGDREMDRKEFLKYSGLVLLSVVGFKTIVATLTQSDTQKIALTQDKTSSTHGFGNGKYGV